MTPSDVKLWGRYLTKVGNQVRSVQVVRLDHTGAGFVVESNGRKLRRKASQLKEA